MIKKVYIAEEFGKKMEEGLLMFKRTLKTGVITFFLSAVIDGCAPTQEHEYQPVQPEIVRVDNVVESAGVTLSSLLVGQVTEGVLDQTQHAEMLENSLLSHQGKYLSEAEMSSFKNVVAEIKGLPFVDSLVRYNKEGRHITSDLLMDDGVLVHLTQYFEEPTDQLVYSIERDGRFLRSGCAPLEGFRNVVDSELEIARITA